MGSSMLQVYKTVPLVTIITVVYNSVNFIESTIQSVLRLPKEGISYICIDGGSTDGTLEILKKYTDHITYWISEPDKGIYDAMNKGWALAESSSYILFLGAGDQIRSLPENLGEYDSNDVVCGSVQLGSGKAFTPRLDYRLKLYNTLHHQALLVKKSIHPEAPFNTDYKVYADFDFNQRLYKQNARFIVASEFESYAMPGGVSQSYPLLESLHIVKSNFGFLWASLSLLFYLYNTAKVTLKRKVLSMVAHDRSYTA